MKGEILNGPYTGHTSQVIFRRGCCCLARWVGVYEEVENACKAAVTDHVIELLVTGLADGFQTPGM